MTWMDWYNSLWKPSWTPAPSTIGLIWQILYPIAWFCMNQREERLPDVDVDENYRQRPRTRKVVSRMSPIFRDMTGMPDEQRSETALSIGAARNSHRCVVLSSEPVG